MTLNRLGRMLAGPWLPPEMGRMPYVWGSCLSFLLFQYIFQPPTARELVFLGLTVLLFVPLYLASFWCTGRAAVLCVLLACLFGVLWMPYNSGASTFFIFAAGMSSRLSPARSAYRLLAAVIGLALLAGQVLWPHGYMFLLGPLTIMLLVGFSSIMEQTLRTARQRLARKQEEVEHLARIAERERISRDLHDLLGHSLSLIALKAELAGKLAARDVDACRREIGDVEATARRALAEVRAAVTGYRDSGLAGALASARASLAAANVELCEDVQPCALPPAAEHVLALALREAVTNVVRHAGATRCTLGLALERGSAVLRVADDGAALGDADTVRAGNGLSGMRERVASIGGSLSIRVDAGLRLELRVPAGEAA